LRDKVALFLEDAVFLSKAVRKHLSSPTSLMNGKNSNAHSPIASSRLSPVIRNEHSVLTVSTLLDGEYGLKDVCLNVPCIVSQYGVERVIEGKLTDCERAALHASASVIKNSIIELTTAGK
jgi:malate/lactate dehydrogenase